MICPFSMKRNTLLYFEEGHACACHSTHVEVRSHRKACGSQFSPSARGLLVIKLRLSGSVADTLSTEEAWGWAHHGTCVEARGPLCGLSSVHPSLYRFRDKTQMARLPAKPSHPSSYEVKAMPVNLGWWSLPRDVHCGSCSSSKAHPVAVFLGSPLVPKISVLIKSNI